MKRNHIVLTLSSFTLAIAAGAAEAHSGKLESCVKAALAKHPGKILSLEAEIEKGKPIYELDIKGKDGKEWEIECDAATGKLTEEEQEVANADDEAFKAKAKVTEEEARKTALGRKAGEVIEVEYNLEADGNPSYEFDIVDKDGKEWEIEVDAVTGKVLEEERELFQIGDE